MIKIRKSDELVGKALNLKKEKTRANGKVQTRKIDPDARARAEEIAVGLHSKGLIGVQEGQPALSDEDQLQQYVLLENIGAPNDAMLKILGCSYKRLMNLRFQARELYISNLTDDGVIGTIGTAFHRIENVSKKIMAQIASLNDDSPRLVDLAKALVDFETKKVDMLVRTGAVKIKRKVEISAQFDQGQIGDPSLFSGDHAMKVLQLIAMEITDVADDGQTEDS